MNARAEPTTSGIDTLKFIIAVLVLASGIVGFYYYGDKALVYRVIGVLLSTLAAIGLILSTTIGKEFMGFLKEARVEVRKVIWPTRQETMQSTLVVVALVFIVGLILWTLDAGLFWGVSLLTGQGK